MQKRLSRILALMMGIPLLLGLLAACGSGTASNTTTTQGSTIIKIGTDLPVSGKDTSNGKPVENGVRLAIDDANANHLIPGYTFVLDPQDDVGPKGVFDGPTGAKNVRSLIGDALVAGIIGPFNSSVAKAEMPITNMAPIAQISPSNTNQCLTQRNPAIGCTGANDLVPTLRPSGKVTYFRVATTDDHQGPVNADYLYKTLGYKTAYVIDDTTVYGVGIATTFSDEWKKLGGTVLGRSSEPGTTTSFVSLLTQVASLKPAVVYYGGTDSSGGTLVRQQMEQVSGLRNTAFAGGDGIVSGSFATTIGSNGGPIYGTVASSDVTKNPIAADFVKKYEAQYGQLGSYSAAGYDCAMIVIQAIKHAFASGAHTPQSSADTAGAKTFRQAVIDGMAKIDYTGLTGHHTFDANGDTTNKVIQIKKLGNLSGNPAWQVITTITLP